MNIYAQTLQKVVKVKDEENGVKDGFVVPAVILGVCMFLCGMIVVAFVLANVFGRTQ